MRVQTEGELSATFDANEMEQSFKQSLASNSELQHSLDAMSDKVRKLSKYEAYYKRHAKKMYRNVGVQVSVKDSSREAKEQLWSQHLKQTTELHSVLQKYL